MLGNIKKTILDILIYTVGGFIYSSAVTLFITPNEISPGGITGVATALSFVSGIPSGLLLFLFNLPLLILGFVKLGGVFIFKTAIASVIVSLTLTVTEFVLPVPEVDKILSAIFGGIIMGFGISLIMLRGATTGGVDIIAKLVNRHHRHLTVGRIILILDFAVILFATFVYKNIESALYSTVVIYTTSFMLDLMLYGSDKGKLIYIVTTNEKLLCYKINNEMNRGVTIISAKGGYTGEEKTLLLCTVRRHEVSALYGIIDEVDPTAFVVVAEVGEIMGEGFKAIK